MQELRYGENPHQAPRSTATSTPAPARSRTTAQLQGKELSYNNIADADAAWECVQLRCAGLRHRQARQSVRRGDRRACAEAATARRSRPIRPRRSAASSPSTGTSTQARARRLPRQFVEVLIAPGFTRAARAALRRKAATCALLQIAPGRRAQRPFDLKRVGGGLLVQSPDDATAAATELRVVTQTSTDGRTAGRTCCSHGTWRSSSSRTRSCSARRADARRRRRPDEPDRFGAHRGDQGGGGRADAGRVGGGVGCVLSVPRRSRRRRRCRRHLRDPAGRLDARRRSDRRGRRARRRDGVHRVRGTSGTELRSARNLAGAPVAQSSRVFRAAHPRHRSGPEPHRLRRRRSARHAADLHRHRRHPRPARRPAQRLRHDPAGHSTK